MRTQVRPSNEPEIKRLTAELEAIKQNIILMIRSNAHNAKDPAEAGSSS